MKCLFPILLVSVLAGCGTVCPEPQTITQVVKVPVPVKCEIDPIDKPNLYFDQAKKDNTVFDNMKLLAAENEELQGYVTKLEAAISGCTK